MQFISLSLIDSALCDKQYMPKQNYQKKEKKVDLLVGSADGGKYWDVHCLT